jgi:hypothetical protein
MPRVSFTAFYPSRPFWAGTKVNFQVPRVERWFHDQMAEVVHSQETEAFALRVCRDGRILIRVPRLERDGPTEAPVPIHDTVRRWGEYLDYLNAFYLLLDSATIEIDHLAYFNLHEITNRDAFRVLYEDGKEVGESVAIESIASVFQMARLVGTYRSESEIEHQGIIAMRRVISSAAIAHAGSEFERVVASAGAEKPLASFAKSLAEYKVGNYETCVILAWFITEVAISTLWESHLDALNRDLPGCRRRIDSDRKHFLTGRDFPTSVVSNMLELFGIVDHRLFEDIDSVRGFRNKIVHPTKFTPGAAEAQLAMKTALTMIERLWNFRLTPSLSYSVTGL